LGESNIKKIVVAGTGFFKLRKKNFLMVFNLETSEADIIKVLDFES
jgi:hypothetical protein